MNYLFNDSVNSIILLLKVSVLLPILIFNNSSMIFNIFFSIPSVDLEGNNRFTDIHTRYEDDGTTITNDTYINNHTGDNSE